MKYRDNLVAGQLSALIDNSHGKLKFDKALVWNLSKQKHTEYSSHTGTELCTSISLHAMLTLLKPVSTV